jgi:hypothetical protein
MRRSTAAYLTGVSARRTHTPVGHGSPDWLDRPCPVCGVMLRAWALRDGYTLLPSHGSTDPDTLTRDPDALCAGSGVVVK